MSESKIEAELRAVREEVKKLAAQFAPLPMALTVPHAAEQLDISPRKMWYLIKQRRVLTVPVGDSQHVPLCELVRLTTPERARELEKAPREKAGTAAARAEAAVVRAALRKRR